MKAALKFSIVIVCLLGIMLGATGCSWLFGEDGTFRDRGNDYRKASVGEVLRLPPDLDDEAIDDTYAIPPISDRTSLSEEFVVPRPEPLREVNQDSVRINTLGSSRWILVDGTPGQVWPRLRGFLNLNQLRVERADATNGMLETAWLQPSGDNALRERYRLRIEQGIQRGTSEVYVLQADIRAGQDSWPKTSSDSERENIMIQELAQYLADSQAAAAVSMLAQQAIDSQGRVILKETNQGQPYLQLALPFARAWASTHNALQKAGFKVTDLNREQNTFYLSYVEGTDEDEEEPGFFSRLFGGGKEEQEAKDYLLQVKPDDAQNVIITIERQNNETMATGEAKTLLKRIQLHLS